MIYVGTSGVTAIYYGLSGATRVYYGSTLAWEADAHDYSKDYLTFKITGDGVLNWKAEGNISKDISYSTDDGANWNTLSVGNSVNVSSGDTVLVKGSNSVYADSYDKYATFSGSTCTFDLEGNIMSLIYADNFTGQTAMTANYNFRMLFRDCTGLTSAENLILPSTTLTNYCYTGMFNGCTSLTTAPTLPATTISEYCYCSMFEGCTSLITAPKLPSTSAPWSCYQTMFKDCTSLVNAPALPATQLGRNCYTGMFNGCTSITTAPELLSTTLGPGSYSQMFRYCTNLNYIKCLAEVGIENETNYWVNGVGQTGKFIGSKNATWPTGNNGVPSGWVYIVDGEGDYLTLKVTGDGDIMYNNMFEPIYYSKNDGANWIEMQPETSLQVQSGDTVLFKGTGISYRYGGFSGSTCSFELEGNIMSLIYGDNFTGQTVLTDMYAFDSLFRDCTGLTSISALYMPATTLSYGCYKSMFQGCTSLVNASTALKELPASSVTDSCYISMFQGCTSLTTAPALPATVLDTNCYESMFEGCTSLTTAPSLPATDLSMCSSCYQNMFKGCTSLSTAPALPATVLEDSCYRGMFAGCASLVVSPALMVAVLTNNCYREMFSGATNLSSIRCDAVTFGSNSTTDWVAGVSQTGLFMGSSAATWTTGNDGVPNGWTYVSGYTPVTAIYPTSPSETSNNIELPYNSSLTLKTRFKGKFMRGTGGIMIGADNLPDDNDYRYFWTGNWGSYLDIGSARISIGGSSGWYGSNINEGISGSPIDITFGVEDGKMLFANNLNEYKNNTTSVSSSPNSPIIAKLNILAIEAIQMWDNDVLVFDGAPAINPANNEIGIVDSISGNFYTPQTQTGVAYIP